MKWHTTENERFVDENYFTDDRFYEDDSDSSSFGEEESGDEDDEHGVEDNMAEAVIDSDQNSTAEEAQTRTSNNLVMSAIEGNEEHREAAVPSCEAGLRQDTVSRFLDVVGDQYAYHASIERLRDFFDDASSPGQLDRSREKIKGVPKCQIVLDDRNLTSLMYRRYRKPFGPADLYHELMNKVGLLPSHAIVTLANKARPEVSSRRHGQPTQTFQTFMGKIKRLQYREKDNVSIIKSSLIGLSLEQVLIFPVMSQTLTNGLP